MNILGISAGYHDAAATVINKGEILFAGHSERYSKIKNDPTIHKDLLQELCEWEYDTVAFYERPWMHNLQQLYTGQRHFGPWTTRQALNRQLGLWYQNPARKEVCFSHHLSHAAAGFQTSKFDRATVVVIDAIGEWDTISIYGAKYNKHGYAKYKKLWSQKYPHSLGLFYSAMNKRAGLKPLDEEYLLSYLNRSDHVIVVEEGSETGGVFSYILSTLGRRSTLPLHNWHCIGIPDRFIDHGKMESLRKHLNLSKDGIIQKAISLCV
mgnify:CR=1 FL=1